MRRNQIIVASLILSAIVISGVVFFLLRSTREPVYQGKRLSVWLKDYDNTKEVFANNGAKLHELDKIVKQTGTKAIPTLLQLLREEDSKKHNIGSNGNEASNGFRALGANAKEAIPALIKIYDKNPAAHVDVLYCLGCIGPAAEEAVPWLLEKLTNTNDKERSWIIDALGSIHAQSALVVPVLTNCLDDSNSTIRAHAAVALGEYGTDAKPAIPQLIDLLNDKVKGVGYRAAFAIKEIDPEAAAKAGLKPAAQTPPIAPPVSP